MSIVPCCSCLFFYTLILSVINQGRVWALMYGGGRSNGVVVLKGLRLHRLRHHDRQHRQHGGQCEDFHHGHPHLPSCEQQCTMCILGNTMAL